MKNYIENRPWGSFEILDEGDGFKVKKITVLSGQRLSLQYHKFRSEHRTVVQGIATATIGNKVSKLKSDESLYIPLNEIHSVANEEKEQLQFIEVQLGNYLGEDDIVRLKDIYNRI